MGIHWRSWFWAGLLAGAILNVSGVVLAHAVLGSDYIEAVRRHVAVATPLPITMVKNIAIRFGYGLLGMFLYVGLRPRFGPGPRTALIAGLALFLGAYGPGILTFTQFGILAGSRLWITVVWSLVEACAACVLGAWTYHEPPAGMAPALPR
jgi:hypothetical protein